MEGGRPTIVEASQLVFSCAGIRSGNRRIKVEVFSTPIIVCSEGVMDEEIYHTKSQLSQMYLRTATERMPTIIDNAETWFVLRSYAVWDDGSPRNSWGRNRRIHD